MKIKTLELKDPSEFDYAVSMLCDRIEEEHDILSVVITHLDTKYVATIVYVKREDVSKPNYQATYTPASKDEMEVPGPAVNMTRPRDDFFDFLGGRDLKRGR